MTALLSNWISNQGIFIPATFVCASATLLLVVAGCLRTTSQPNYSKLGLVKVSGVVKLDGKPLEGAAVYFHDRPNRRYSYGVTDSSGRYSLMFDSREPGIMPGEKQIEITTTKNPFANPALGEEGEADENNTDQSRRELVPSRYNSRTELTYNVTKSENNVNFDLATAEK